VSAYQAPTSVPEALALLGSDPAARVLAGGTDLLVQVRSGRPPPSLYVDVKLISELMRIEVDAESLRIGAAAPAAEIVEHAEIRAGWPGLAEATDLIGSTQIQGRASLGGNLCNGSPAADTTPVLIALAAECVIAGPEGQRALPVAEFVTGPGTTALGAGELLVELRIPRLPPSSADAYLRLIPRSEMDIAVVGAGANVTLDVEGRCSAARVAIGAVAPTPRLVPGAAQVLVGQAIDDESLERAAAAAREAADPIDDKRGTREYRRKVAGVLVKRVLQIAAERARERS
jgi:CO/xanthine dehydrogenase FAD-binding subunit